MPKRLKDYQIGSDQVEEIRNKKKPRKFKDNEDYNKNKKRKKMIKQLLKYCLNLLFPKKKELLLNEITVDPLKKIKDIQIYDDVYIQIDNQIYTA